MRTLFTKQERVGIRLLVFLILIGLVAGFVREQYFTLDVTDQFMHDVQSFQEASTAIDQPLSNEQQSALKTNDIKYDNSVKLIDINLANKEELVSIPGIGPVTAERIIRFREDYGAFKTLDDLLKIKGIGPKSLAKMKTYIQIKHNHNEE